MKLTQCLASVAMIVSAGLSSSAQAFKVDSHVWIGQQIINELETTNGELHFDLTPDDDQDDPIAIKINSSLYQAIINNPGAYRFGHVGPDAAPDIIAGQGVIHPGHENEAEWQADQWMDWVVRNASTGEELAYAYGMLGHAAGDVFAHTYVNHYAGGEFDFNDDNNDAEIRHAALESYISSYLPPIVDRHGQAIPAQLMLKSPKQFLSNTFYFNDTAAERFSNTTGAYITQIHNLRKNLIAAINWDGWIEMDRVIGEYVINLWISYDFTDKQMDYINDFMFRLAHENNEFAGEISKGIDKLSEFLIDVAEFDIARVQEIAAKVNRIVNDLLQAHQRAISAKNNLIHELNGLRSDLHAIEDRLLTKAVLDGIKAACAADYPYSSSKRKKCRARRKNSFLKAKAAWSNVFNKIEELEVDLLTLDQEIAELDLVFKEPGLAIVEEGLKLARDMVEAEMNTRRALIGALEATQGDHNPLRNFLSQWQFGIENAIATYLNANENTMKRIVNHQENASEPLRSWANCEVFGLIGLGVWEPLDDNVPPIYDDGEHAQRPAEPPEGDFDRDRSFFCKAVDNYKAVIDHITTIKDLMRKLEMDPLLATLLDGLKNKLQDLALDEALRLAEKHIEDLDYYIDVVKMLKGDMNDERITSIFSTVISDEPILVIPDIVARIREDMNVTHSTQRTFDKNRFAMVYNSIVLAKLALLDHQQLNQLATEARKRLTGNDSVWKLFRGSQANIFTKAIRSLDGNHAWMPYSPTYPRSIDDPRWSNPENYIKEEIDDVRTPFYREYAWRGEGKGFTLWTNESAKDMLFLKLFKGPLSPGIDAPLSVHPILPYSFPYKACEAVPFPASFIDNSCAVIGESNQPPSVNAGDDRFASAGQRVSINASATDSDGQIRQYQWQQLSGINVNLSGASSATMSFTTPRVSSGQHRLVFEVSVKDDVGAEAKDQVSVTVIAAPQPCAGPACREP